MVERYIIDLFSGCGGLSQGFKDAGFKIAFANDIDANCAKTYVYNHCNHGGKIPFHQGDIRTIKNEQIKKLIGNKKITGVIGGPPCQGFSIAGKRLPNDPRNHLVYKFMQVVEGFQPDFFLMENVTGLMSMDGGKTIKKLIDEFSKMEYRINVKNMVIDASNFGVPQIRKRVFILGLNPNYQREPTLPKPSKKKKVSVNQAISDLPPVKAGEGEEEMKYTRKAKTAYQKWARNGGDILYNHVAMKHTDRIIDRFKATEQGQGIKDVASMHPVAVRNGRSSHILFTQNHNRLIGNLPAPTIAAGFKINFIHPILDRSLTAREGARLQSFRDSFRFFGKRTMMSWEEGLEQYEQIGNAVPPLLAQAVAEHIKKCFL